MSSHPSLEGVISITTVEHLRCDHLLCIFISQRLGVLLNTRQMLMLGTFLLVDRVIGFKGLAESIANSGRFFVTRLRVSASQIRSCVCQADT